ncbi:protein ORF4 [Cyprinid herpesvirus 3]|uniref:ORF4R n=1 Tax=Cyprinid herpesvirus 3 TaxID=180230 RepID=A3QMH6_CYHV3|nr:unnamed protein product [Cyprinid herpesvirus 3]YP_001096195.1 unnamed protein product [Cyprinid herpesvirus 3]ABC55075.1 hypothetical protein [Cyprinid herpesvirus 3]ABC55242.1 hypothetical protein [Cyprinid herpesvirus 3]ABG42835.1 protein ORF4 [Cyprinid herpesvirus 3]ABG42987.1 protein ORF4 [Cyprinid herpesvirus 3]AIC32359.1 ORF4R [Cyprinid herpesvirus 3]
MFKLLMLVLCSACALCNKPLMKVPDAPPPQVPPPPQMRRAVVDLEQMVADAYALDVSEWYFRPTYEHRCPNGFGSYGWVEDFMVATCDSHSNKQRELYGLDADRKMTHKWSMVIREHNESRTVSDLCDVCNPCDRFEYLSPAGVCCKPCYPGYYAVQHCATAHTASVCEACPVGTYKSNAHVGTTSHLELCMDHHECPKNTHPRDGVFEASAVQDVFCDPDHGYYCPAIQEGASCSLVSGAKWAGCYPGSYIFKFPTREASAVCATCDSEKEHIYISKSGLAKCILHTKCERVQEKGSLNKDTICLELKHEEL